MADKSTCCDFRTIDLWKYKPNHDISVLLSMSISIFYMNVVPELNVKFPLFRDATTRARIFLFFSGVDILNLDTHVRSFING